MNLVLSFILADNSSEGRSSKLRSLYALLSFLSQKFSKCQDLIRHRILLVEAKNLLTSLYVISVCSYWWSLEVQLLHTQCFFFSCWFSFYCCYYYFPFILLHFYISRSWFLLHCWLKKTNLMWYWIMANDIAYTKWSLLRKNCDKKFKYN